MTIDTIIRTEDMSQDEQNDLAMSMVSGENNIKGVQIAKQDAILGRLTPRTITAKFVGETPAAALGSAYNVRDIIEREADFDVTASLTGTKWETPYGNMFEVRINIS